MDEFKRQLRQALTPINRTNGLEGCNHCQHFEDDGTLRNHCDACCRAVTTLVCKFLLPAPPVLEVNDES